MEDREEKLSKAREKLDKFRKKKQKNIEPSVTVVSDEGESKASSTTSPVMFIKPSSPFSVLPSPQQVTQEQQPTNSSEEASITSAAISLDSFVTPEAPGIGDQSNLASYFGSSVSESETVQQFYIGEGKPSHLDTDLY